jgi:uncharacterized membrane protein YdjX (TVP38/TMEM64 family)
MAARGRVIRIVAVVIVIAALVTIAFTTDLRSRFSIDGLRSFITACGVGGIAGFVAAFCVGLLVYVPGMVFLAVSMLAWGPYLGAAIGFAGSTIAVTASFIIVRAVGGQPLAALRSKWIQRAMARLETHPIQTVFLLRLILWTSPPLNYGFALSSLRFRDHLIGSMLGLVAPVVVMAAFTESVVDLLGL